MIISLDYKYWFESWRWLSSDNKDHYCKQRFIDVMGAVRMIEITIGRDRKFNLHIHSIMFLSYWEDNYICYIENIEFPYELYEAYKYSFKDSQIDQLDYF